MADLMNALAESLAATCGPLSDERIEAALARTAITPEFCEWYGGGRVTFRIETHIGHYAEVTLEAVMTDEHLIERIESCSRALEARSGG